jgi:opacity protein-like surface antigen
MKKRIGALLAGIFFLNAPNWAQPFKGVGVKIGAVSANQDWNYTYGLPGLNSDARRGLDAGVFAEWPISTTFGFLTEVHYIQKGFMDKTPVTSVEGPAGTGETFTWSPRIDYISIPLLVKAGFNAKGASWYAVAGPRYDSRTAIHDELNENVLKHFKKSEWNATFGVGVEFLRDSPWRVGAEFRYSPNLQKSYSTELLTIKNRSVEILLVACYSPLRH